MSAESRPYLVFISHATKDRWVARKVAEEIEKAGAQTFLDEKDIEGGDSIPETIRERLEACDELIVLLSASSIARPWVLIEIGAAWGLRKRIVAVIDKLSPSEIPDPIAPYKAYDLNDLDRYLEEVGARARAPSNPRRS